MERLILPQLKQLSDPSETLSPGQGGPLFPATLTVPSPAPPDLGTSTSAKLTKAQREAQRQGRAVGCRMFPFPTWCLQVWLVPGFWHGPRWVLGSLGWAQVGSRVPAVAAPEHTRRAGSHRCYHTGIKFCKTPWLQIEKCTWLPSRHRCSRETPIAVPLADPLGSSLLLPAGEGRPGSCPLPARPARASHFSREIPTQSEDFTTLFSEYHNIFFFN